MEDKFINNDKYYQKYLKYKMKYISLKQQGGDPDDEVINKIKNAIETNDIGVLKEIDKVTLKRLFNNIYILSIHREIHTPLTYTVKKKYNDITEYLLDNGAESILNKEYMTIGEIYIDTLGDARTPTERGDIPIVLALKENNIEIAKLLLDKQIKASKKIDDNILIEILILAIKGDYQDIIDFVIYNYQDILNHVNIQIHEYEYEFKYDIHIFNKLVELLIKRSNFTTNMLINIFKFYKDKFKVITVTDNKIDSVVINSYIKNFLRDLFFEKEKNKNEYKYKYNIKIISEEIKKEIKKITIDKNKLLKERKKITKGIYYSDTDLKKLENIETVATKMLEADKILEAIKQI